MITPPIDLSNLDWQSVLFEGQVLEISNNEGFKSQFAADCKSEITFEGSEEPAWLARVIHSDRALICAVLLNDLNSDETLFEVDEMAFVKPDATDPSSERGADAMAAAGLRSEEGDISDILTQLGAVDSTSL